MSFAPKIAVKQEVIVGVITMALLYLHAFGGHHQHMFNLSRVVTLLYVTDFRSEAAAKLASI